MSDAVIVSIVVACVQVLAFVGGGLAVSYRIGQSMSRLDQYSEIHTRAIASLNDEMKVMRGLMTEVALQKRDIEQLRSWYDELRHGEGYVFPLKYSRQATQD